MSSGGKGASLEPSFPSAPSPTLRPEHHPRSVIVAQSSSSSCFPRRRFCSCRRLSGTRRDSARSCIWWIFLLCISLVSMDSYRQVGMFEGSQTPWRAYHHRGEHRARPTRPQGGRSNAKHLPRSAAACTRTVQSHVQQSQSTLVIIQIEQPEGLLFVIDVLPHNTVRVQTAQPSL